MIRPLDIYPFTCLRVIGFSHREDLTSGGVMLLTMQIERVPGSLNLLSYAEKSGPRVGLGSIKMTPVTYEEARSRFGSFHF